MSENAVEKAPVDVGEMLCLVREQHGWTFRIQSAKLPEDGIEFAVAWRATSFDELIDRVREYIDVSPE
jgi:hypothetical protein